jgi:KDO2-lipid IV(A) lauroyltransferase
MSSKPSARGLRARLIALIDGALGHFAAGCLHVLRLFNRQVMANFTGAVARMVGPWLPEHRVGRANLIAAFPEKTPAEIENILRGVWDNLGRFAAEFAHLDRIKIYDPAVPGSFDVEYSEQALQRFHALRTDGKPALLFTAHLANWELPALVAHRYQLDAVVLYRRPNLGAAADAVARIRAGSMGTLMATGLDAPVKLADALLAGRHVAMLVDQYAVNGVDVTFFGQRTRANPLIARLARQVECPIHGTRIVRLPGGRFRIDLTEAIEPARGADGRIDIAGTMQAITTVIEGWIREHPEQWLWVHRRWRPGDPRPFSARSSPSSKAD